MSVVLMSALNCLGWATAGVTMMAIATWLLMRMCQVQSPEIQRFAWLLVLLPGVVVWRMSVVLPVLPAQQVASVDLSQEILRDRPTSETGAGSWSLAGSNDFTSIAATSYGTWCVGTGAVFLGGWAAGLIVLAARSVHSYLAFARGLPQALPVTLQWEEELKEACDQLSIPRPIKLHVTSRLGPALCLLPHGYRLLIPQAAWRQFSSQQRQAILRHELAHYVRGDLWKSLLARLLAWPQWFNPLAWLAVRQFEEAAEWACDDTAVAAERDGAFDYLRALLELGNANLSTTSLQAAIHGGSLQCRVRRLLSPIGKDSLMKKLVVVVAALALATGGFARIRFAAAQSPAPPSSKGPTAPAKGGAATKPAEENLSVSLRDSKRPTTSTPVLSGQEAVIDVARVFKELDGFQQQMSAIKDKIKKFDEECKEEQAKLSALQAEQQATSEAGRRKQLENELADGKAKLQSQVAETKKEFLQVEATIYNDWYEQMRTTIAEYAKAHGIRIVHRHQSFGPIDDKVDATDRQAVLARVNRPIVYLDGPIDITDIILQRMNDSTARR